MNIESTSTVPAKQTSDNKSSSTDSSKNLSSTSFKDELRAVKTENKNTEETLTTQEQKDAETQTKQNDLNNIQNSNKIAQEKLAEQTKKEQIASEKTIKEDRLAQNKVSDSLEELKSQIATLNGLKTNPIQGAISKNGEVKTDKASNGDDYCKTIKMNNQDVSFFLNLVENKQMIAQNIQGTNPNSNNNFNNILLKPTDNTSATQQTVAVSQALIDSLNDASKTGKPVRIDFDKDISVILKVDKNGTLSANFIPGDAAVENYLRNNIAGLRQNFEEQGLAYNELSYNRHSQQDKNNKEKNQSNNKESENE